MILVDLVQNIALLIALAAGYQVTVSRSQQSALTRTLVMGFLFGVVGIFAMMTPIQYVPGIIFDGRSIILAVAGLIGGPAVALISALNSSAYRIWLGGGGAYVGVAVIASSAAIGVAFHYIRKRSGGYLRALPLLGFGFLVHAVMLSIFLFLPDGVGARVIREMGLTMILFYPSATMLVCLLFQDYEEKERARGDLEHLAYHDTLTGLPNRSHLIEKLSQSLSSCKQSGCESALILLNLDRFKTLNDARGHASGDTLLRGVAARLKTIVEPRDILARMSADEYAILLKCARIESETIVARAQCLAEKVHTALRFPLRIGPDETAITCSLGIALLPQSTDDMPGDVLRRANTAMHRAKRNGGNQSLLFEQSMTSMAEQRFQVERELREAIAAGQLQLHLQSQVDSAGNIVGAEALVRWQHPERGLILPAAFIPLAEESDLIVDVGGWVLTEACAILARDEMAGCPVRLSVNISPRHFAKPGFVAEVMRIIADTGADPGRLTLEITEGLLVNDINDVIAKMTELTSMGIHFSLDDFGTGYSSLTYLKRLPIQELKIDKTFVQDAPSNSDNAALVETILAVAKHMKLDVVAEGVETREHAAFLKARADVISQGYLFGKPEPSDVWLRHLSESNLSVASNEDRPLDQVPGFAF